MQIGHVIGTATSTVKHPSLTGWKLLIVQFVGTTGDADGEPVIVFDTLGAGAGDRVLASNDGAELQRLMKTKATPARWFVAGIVDS